MHGYLKDHPGVFAPDEVRTLVATFDKAWASVQAGGASSTRPLRLNLRGQYSQNILLKPLRKASVTSVGYATAL
jgi:hypothetical protein